MAVSIRLISNYAKLMRSGTVQTDSANSVFYIPFNDHRAFVQYRLKNNDYDLVHSQVPPELKGHGLGGILAEKVFDHLVSRGKKFYISCSFLYDQYEKNRRKYEGYVLN